MKINNLELIKQVFSPNKKYDIKEKGLGQWDMDITEQGIIKMKSAKQFLLNIEKAQGFYDDMEGKPKHRQLEGTFEFPFDECLFAFENPITIRWRSGAGKNPDDYVSKPIVGFLSYPILDKTEIKGIKLPKNGAHEVDAWARTYRMHMFSVEDRELAVGVPDNIEVVLGIQHILFTILGYKDQNTSKIFVNQLHHYPCGNKLLCNIDNNGCDKIVDTKKAWVCEEIVVRDAWLETVQYLVNKINDTQFVWKKPSSWWKEKTAGKFLPALPFGWPLTKGNLPKDNYVLNLDSLHYRYDPKDIDYGSGTKHRYRYDVRRHPRIVGDHLIWIDPHQRGSGKYIPKIYSNRKTWFIGYLWQQAEKLTKYRIFEILIIRFLKFIKPRKGGEKND